MLNPLHHKSTSLQSHIHPPGGIAVLRPFRLYLSPRSFLMQDKLITLSHPSTGLEDLIQKANDLIQAAKAPSTRKAY